MDKIKLIEVPTHTDPRGNLSAIELKDYVDWTPKRVYYVTDTKLMRGGHAVFGERKIYICMQGTMRGRFHDGEKWHEFDMRGPKDAVVMDGFCWREFSDLSEGAVLCAISNMNYDKDKYVFDFERFLEEVKKQGN